MTKILLFRSVVDLQCQNPSLSGWLEDARHLDVTITLDAIPNNEIVVGDVSGYML